MLTIEEAHRIACKSSRYEHSLTVGSIMRVLAQEWGQDQRLWQITGILHDIDWDETRDTKEKHGVKAAELLEGKIPAGALLAIMSHDFRTGVKPVSRLDNALIFADALAHIFSGMKDTGFNYSMFEGTMERVTELGRPWMREIVEKYIEENDLSQDFIGKLWSSKEYDTS